MKVKKIADDEFVIICDDAMRRFIADALDFFRQNQGVEEEDEQKIDDIINCLDNGYDR